MKKSLFIFLIIAGCSTTKKAQLWTITKPETQREWEIFNMVDSLVCETIHLDSMTYDWNNKIEYDWKNGIPKSHKFK